MQKQAMFAILHIRCMRGLMGMPVLPLWHALLLAICITTLLTNELKRDNRTVLIEITTQRVIGETHRRNRFL
jgi:hypothetical protein